ncbi:MAG: cytochrome c3 family protein [bacterium]|nr:cytochrome c3 family protein [bacterium]
MIRFIIHIQLMVLTLFLVSASTASAQLSPGDLAEVHESFEGISNCTNCHELGEGPSASKCLDCHAALKKRLDKKRGYHHLLLNEPGKTCFDCHSEHAGRDFELIRWPNGMENFRHNDAGYPLQGKHAKTKCRDCHNPSLIKNISEAEAESTDITRTYLGLDTSCTSCHTDIHRSQLGIDCTQCHSQESFKPATGFNHASTKFPLSGKHHTVECGKCHPVVSLEAFAEDNQKEYIKYSGIAHTNCTSCHKDIHSGKFGDNCVRCHTNEGWKIIRGESFDHSKTRYPLLGKHRDLKCDKCHKSDSQTGSLKFTLCTDCHRDPHAAQFTALPDSGKCELCHDVNGFLPARFGLTEHEQTEFKLLGAHRAQPCIACHKTVGEGETAYRLYTLKSEQCTDCHTDQHAGQFTTGEKAKVCLDCHTIDRWEIADFDHSKQTAYALTGAHKKVACLDCHQNESIRGIETLRYRPLRTDCESCHKVAVNELDLREG